VISITNVNPDDTELICDFLYYFIYCD